MVYVDDAILISPSPTKLQRKISSLQTDFDLTDDGALKDYLGTSSKTITLTQPKMIQCVLELVDLHDKEHVKLHNTPACATHLLDDNLEALPKRQSWNYQAVVGCLSYLNAMVCPDITMAVQQCARFCNNPSREHEEAVKRICRYLLKTKDTGLIMRPDKSKGLKCYVDADWAGSWQYRSSHNPTSTLSYWLRHHVRQLPYPLVFQDSNPNCTQYYQS